LLWRWEQSPITYGGHDLIEAEGNPSKGESDWSPLLNICEAQQGETKQASSAVLVFDLRAGLEQMDGSQPPELWISEQYHHR
jgi:hypothetical protein